MNNRKPQFKVGQVVSLAKVDLYNAGRGKAEMFQKITAIRPWMGKESLGYELSFQNKDRCHEKYATALNAKQRGGY